MDTKEIWEPYRRRIKRARRKWRRALARIIRTPSGGASDSAYYAAARATYAEKRAIHTYERDYERLFGALRPEVG